MRRQLCITRRGFLNAAAATADMRVSESHVIASEVEHRVREHFGQAAFVSIHVEPLSEE